MHFIVTTGATRPKHLLYAAAMAARGNHRGRSLWLLLIPVLALIFPGIYNRETPALFGLPFFYWYQLAWVVLATVILAIVYKLRKGMPEE